MSMELKTVYHVMNEIVICVDDMKENGFNEQSLDKLAWLTNQIRDMVEGMEPLNIYVKDGKWKAEGHLDLVEMFHKKMGITNDKKEKQ